MKLPRKIHHILCGSVGLILLVGVFSGWGNAQNVGIGTKAPQYLLDVVGNAHIQGPLTIGDTTGSNYYTLPNTDGSSGQVLKTDGSGNVSWQNDAGGLTSVNTTARISGDGTSGNPLDIAQNGASSGQVLEWNGTNWVPANDDVNNYSAGSGLQLSGSTFSESCPSGTVDMGTFCVENDDNFTETFFNASNDCGSKDMRLCSMSEMQIVMNNKGSINYNTNGFFEWVDDWTWDDGDAQEEVKVVYIDGDFFSTQPPSETAVTYRCCVDK